MRTLSLLLVAVLASGVAVGQSVDLDHLMKQRFISCNDIFLNSTQLIPSYHKNLENDSVRMILNYWKERCGEQEMITRSEILLNIEEQKFAEGFYQGRLLDILMDYKLSSRRRNEYLTMYAGDDLFRMRYLNDNYREFTKEWAASLKDSVDTTSLSYAILEFYTDNFDPLLNGLGKNSFPGTDIQQKYNQTVEEINRSVDTHMSLFAEVWIPNGNLKLIGTHPGIGFQYGIRSRRLTVDMVLLFRFIKSPNYYQVFDQDSMFTTNEFFGGHFGAEFGYEVYQSRKSCLGFLGGIGFEGFDAVKENQRENIENVSINTLNLNAGLGYRYFYDGDAYLGIQARYNVLDFDTKGGTDLSGHAVSIRLLWGLSSNWHKTYSNEVLNRR